MQWIMQIQNISNTTSGMTIPIQMYFIFGNKFCSRYLLIFSNNVAIAVANGIVLCARTSFKSLKSRVLNCKWNGCLIVYQTSERLSLLRSSYLVLSLKACLFHLGYRTTQLHELWRMIISRYHNLICMSVTILAKVLMLVAEAMFLQPTHSPLTTHKIKLHISSSLSPSSSLSSPSLYNSRFMKCQSLLMFRSRNNDTRCMIYNFIIYIYITLLFPYID